MPGQGQQGRRGNPVGTGRGSKRHGGQGCRGQRGAGMGAGPTPGAGPENGMNTDISPDTTMGRRRRDGSCLREMRQTRQRSVDSVFTHA